MPFVEEEPVVVNATPAKEADGFKCPGDALVSATLPRVLRVLRMAYGWSQKDLAEEIGTWRTRVVKVEAGTNTPTPAALAKYVKPFGLTISDVMLMCEAAA